MAPEAIDAIFISFFADVDHWYNDGDPLPPKPVLRQPVTAKPRMRRLRQAAEGISVDGKLLDFSRFLSWTRYGTTLEYDRYDPFSMAMLTGMYFTGFLNRHGYSVHVVNATNRISIQNLEGKYDPRFVMVSSTLFVDLATLRSCIQKVRALWPDALLVVGGLQLVDLEKNIPRAEVKEFLKAYGADVYVISPQGELPMLEIMRRETKAGLVAGPPIPSTWIVDGNTVHEPASEIEAALSMVDARTHWGHVPDDRLYHMVNLRTARSCAFSCAFCSYPVNQGPLTLMPIELVEQELKELQAKGHVRSLVFIDDTFNVPVPRFKDLMRMMAKYDFEWYSFFRPQFADEDTVKLMKAAGCRSVFLGVESADDEVLKNMNKATTSEKMRRGTAMLREYGIATHANFIVGFPGDTEEKAAKLVDFVDSLGVDFYGILPWLYIHSTPIHQRAQEFGLEGSLERWRHHTMTSETAFQLADDLSRASQHAVFVPSWATQPGASQWMLLANGFSVDEAKASLKTFGRYHATDVSEDDLRNAPDVVELKRVLDRYEMPKPVNL